MRNNTKEYEAETGQRCRIPLSVRHLEALIRVSEALAKLRLAPFAAERDVLEALRLFHVSTLDAANNGSLSQLEGPPHFPSLPTSLPSPLPFPPLPSLHYSLPLHTLCSTSLLYSLSTCDLSPLHFQFLLFVECSSLVPQFCVYLLQPFFIWTFALHSPYPSSVLLFTPFART